MAGGRILSKPAIKLNHGFHRPLECVPEEFGFIPQHRDDVESVGILSEIMVRNELLRCAAHYLLLPPVDEFPWFAEPARTSRLHFHENQRILFKSNDIQFSRAVAMAASQYVEAQPQKIPAGDPFASAAPEQMHCGHEDNISAGRVLFQR